MFRNGLAVRDDIGRADSKPNKWRDLVTGEEVRALLGRTKYCKALWRHDIRQQYSRRQAIRSKLFLRPQISSKHFVFEALI